MRYTLSILALVAIVGFGYFAATQYTTVVYGQSSLLTPDSGSGTVSADGAQVLALLNRLQKINLDGKIFTNPNFTSLQDFHVDIAPQSVGRPNPYLPVYGAVVVSTTTTKVALPKAKK